MAKARPKVSTIRQTVKAFGGRDALARSFCTDDMQSWIHARVPRAHLSRIERRGISHRLGSSNSRAGAICRECSND